ncbi:UNVERIFIED_CONTAM: hypothetical protein FKN15_055117 [Acipenser sinensis]
MNHLEQGLNKDQDWKARLWLPLLNMDSKCMILNDPPAYFTSIHHTKKAEIQAYIPHVVQAAGRERVERLEDS